MHETAYAKLNLALHVRGRETDGYHRIETVFAFAEDGDTLAVAEADDLTLTVTGPFAGQLGSVRRQSGAARRARAAQPLSWRAPARR